ncbi:FHA domain-containing protein [Dermatophilus congolensis]|nr:FHA domain-containing protein [Dermatophilus congolensis]MBO3130460.1 FHA domain-containing protein [Dermatophilus congolensis]MBO3130910.1 FHA domain-containing protein [Dermatophilus congolensis]MBO3134931.1 FHA domain-containing protein [Dermatophilus congolensis]MBO3137171.1 FHA domain-containing protein [Dermatophilus congolensis]MBO3139414.1 FHA domain-containing protein [Dermatophilus congolensis]
MGEFTLTVVRLGLLIGLWLFIFAIVGVLRTDLYGTRIVHRTRNGDSIIRPAASTPSRGRGRRRAFTHLAVIDGPLRGVTVPLKESGVLLGRNPEATLVLDDDYASGRHARIYYDGSDWYVEDLNSTNGTLVDGAAIDQPQKIGEHNQLRIGTTVLELRR